MGKYKMRNISVNEITNNARQTSFETYKQRYGSK